jgi:hypothetical protein
LQVAPKCTTKQDRFRQKSGSGDQLDYDYLSAAENAFSDRFGGLSKRLSRPKQLRPLALGNQGAECFMLFDVVAFDLIREQVYSTEFTIPAQTNWLAGWLAGVNTAISSEHL